MEPPETDRPLTTINDPLFQEWADFRCRQFAAYYGEMEQYIRGLNPEVAVENNPHSGISGSQHRLGARRGLPAPACPNRRGVDRRRQRGGVDSKGVLISKIRTYKMAASSGQQHLHLHGRPARAASCRWRRRWPTTARTWGWWGACLAGYDLPEDQRRYIRFFRRILRSVSATSTAVADVAVLHSFASMAYNNDLPWQSSMLFEQALIQAKVPFDIIFDDHLKDLSKYRVLVLPDQECLAEQQMGLIREYVRKGGGLLATEQTSRYDAWRRRRQGFGLGDLFGTESGAAARRNSGQGRCAYLPSVKPAVQKPAGASMTSQYWKLPLNWQEIIEAVKWAATGVSLEVKGPRTLVVEALEQEPGNRLLVHLLNYDDARHPSVENIAVSVRVPQGKTVRAVRLMSPDSAATPALPHTTSGDSVAFTVPRVRTYSIAVVSF